ncbi:MAG: hypothetical protein U0892_01345 [Pirellulales bacterium]
MHILIRALRKRHADHKGNRVGCFRRDTILIDADLESQQVDIVKKALIIEGVGEPRPTIKSHSLGQEGIIPICFEPTLI